MNASWAKCASMAATMLAAGTAGAQVELFAVDFPGNLYRVNQTTGAATLIAATGTDRLNSAAADGAGVIYASRSRNPTVATDTNRLIRIDPTTGAGTLIVDYGTATNDLRGIAFGRGGVLYGVRDGSPDQLVSIDATTGAVTLVGSTGQTDLQGLASNATGDLFAVGVTSPGRLYQVDATTGAATLITNVSGGVAPGELQALEWFGGQRAYTGRSSLWAIDLVSGAATVIGPFGVTDVRGLAAVRARCYADCDQNNALNVNDFICFQAAFAAGASYADCDHNSALNVNDFICFQAAFAAGCP